MIAEVFCLFGMHQTQHQVTIAVGDVHEDVERAAGVARASYDAGLKGLRANRKFDEVGEEMLEPVLAAGGWMRGPQIHGLNPLVPIARIPMNFGQLDHIERYPDLPGSVPAVDSDMIPEPGMTFAFEPSCGFGNRAVTIGGTVIVGDDGPAELNPYTAQLLRAG
ncbi:M24 family metallopeptidase [Amycolatopsis sp. GM8]|uniref:M24 family metallopeptidase n=1 Tax=Amycolatopsis sp. GM8 TaxID=2896530 RepID=UPI001F2DD834|nr:M24 family metallopeptidase [Amycolatopsis sp. GM8]